MSLRFGLFTFTKVLFEDVMSEQGCSPWFCCQLDHFWDNKTVSCAHYYWRHHRQTSWQLCVQLSSFKIDAKIAVRTFGEAQFWQRALLKSKNFPGGHAPSLISLIPSWFFTLECPPPPWPFQISAPCCDEPSIGSNALCRTMTHRDTFTVQMEVSFSCTV